MLHHCVPGATYGRRASIVPLYKDAAIVEHPVAYVLQEYAFLENLDGECINGRKTVYDEAMSGAGVSWEQVRVDGMEFADDSALK